MYHIVWIGRKIFEKCVAKEKYRFLFEKIIKMVGGKQKNTYY